jgi:integrase/recombinase XerD
MENNEAMKKMKMYMELRGLAPSTQKNYLIYVRVFSAKCKKELYELTSNDAEEYLYTLIKKKFSGAYLTAVYSAIKFLYHYVFGKKNFMHSIPIYKKKVRLPQVLSVDEVRDIINSAANLKHKAIIATIYSSGIRLSEAAKLRIEDIDSKNMRIFIRKGKFHKDRYTILAKNTLDILRKYYKEYKPKEWLFQGRNRKNPISPKSIQAAFKKALGYSHANKDATVHTLRHSFATHLIDNGAHLLALKELLGHNSLSTTSVYLHISATRFSKIKSPADMRRNFFNV